MALMALRLPLLALMALRLTTNGIKADIIGAKECSWRLGAVSESLAYALIGCRAKIIAIFVTFLQSRDNSSTDFPLDSSNVPIR